MRTVGLALLAAAVGCIPDRGSPLDAAVEPAPAPDMAPPPMDKPGPDGAPPADTMDGDTGMPDLPPAGCGMPDLQIDVMTSGTVYIPDEKDVPAGKCIKYCVKNPGGERHTNDSDDGLFPVFDSAGGETSCVILDKVLPARATPYRFFCRQHFGMELKVTVK